MAFRYLGTESAPSRSAPAGCGPPAAPARPPLPALHHHGTPRERL